MNKLLTTCAVALILSACQPQPEKDGPVTQREASLIHLAQTMRQGNDAQGAVDLYLRAIGLSQKRVNAHLELAGLYQQLKQPDKAEAILLAAKERQPDHPKVNLELAKSEIAGGDAQKAIVYFDDGLKSAANDADLLNGKAIALDMLMRHTEAQAIYRKLLTTSPKDSDFIRNNLAMSLIMNGDYSAAIAELEGMTSMAQTPVMRQNLALAYGLKGNMAKAREWALKDVSPEQFTENLTFYQAYTKKLRELEKKQQQEAEPAPKP